MRRVASQVVFTTHTPVPAGHDRFSADLIEEHLGPVRDALRLPQHEFLALGRVESTRSSRGILHDRPGAEDLAPRQRGVVAARPGVARDVAAALPRASRRARAHRPRHQRGARAHLAGAADARRSTTGISVPTGRRAATRGSGRRSRRSIPASSGKRTRRSSRASSMNSGGGAMQQEERRGESPAVLAQLQRALSPDTLTIGFARRFATYKRANLLLRDLEALAGAGQSSADAGAAHLCRQVASARRSRKAGAAGSRAADT